MVLLCVMKDALLIGVVIPLKAFMVRQILGSGVNLLKLFAISLKDDFLASLISLRHRALAFW